MADTLWVVYKGMIKSYYEQIDHYDALTAKFEYLLLI